MKRKLLCCLLAANCASACAQTKSHKPHDAMLPSEQTQKDTRTSATARAQGTAHTNVLPQKLEAVSKADFLGKVDQFGKYIELNRQDDAKNAWSEIEQMINSAFRFAEQKHDELEKSDKEAATKLFEGQNEQSRRFDKLTVLAANMKDNKSEMVKLLTEFASTMP